MISPREVVPIILSMEKPGSVLDVGCGTGTWLKAFEEAGITDYMGVDGDYVDRTKLKISTSRFVPYDISIPLDLQRSFDLVLSLEVGEHLPPEAADTYVESLVRHGKTILFSAAIPGQDGQNHINEQWPGYWQTKFARHGYFFHDVVRPLIWDNPKVEWWYRQNIFLISKKPSLDKIVNCIHPELFETRKRELRASIAFIQSGKLGVSSSFKLLMRSISQKILNK